MNTTNLSYFKQCAPAVKTTRIFQGNLLLVKCKRSHNKSTNTLLLQAVDSPRQAGPPFDTPLQQNTVTLLHQ